ncbi:MAG: PAS domain S-box protein, partial [Pirellulaceae bacterium]
MSKKRSLKAAAIAKPATNPWLKLASASLESLQANVFIADLDLKIIYINGCAQQTLGKIAGEVRRVFHVEVDKILGLSIHAFHKDAARVEKILNNPQALPHHAEFTFGKITLEARINSIAGAAGEVLGYVVAWEDITYRQRLELDYAGQIAAIQRSQAVIEFELDGTIIDANEIFLKTLGYTLEEVKGQRHSMFVDEGTRMSAEYRDHW